MTDYTRSTGTTGQLMIRDTGTYCEFWLYAGTGTHLATLQWRETKAGVVGGWQSFNYSNSGTWMLVHTTANITVDTTFTFEIGATGTQGFGGPTALTVRVARGAKLPPDPPSMQSATVLSDHQVRVQWTPGFNQNNTADQWQLGWGTSSVAPQQWGDSDGDTTFQNLLPGTKYWFWARTHNEAGWSGTGGPITATTWDVPGRPTYPVLSNITQTSMNVSFTVPDTGGTPILERQISWGTTYTASDKVVASDGNTTIIGLPDGQAIGVKARARNAVGWGPWSQVASTQTLIKPGTYVNINGTWYPAVAYVKYNGAWFKAKPQVMMFGVWEVTG